MILYHKDQLALVNEALILGIILQENSGYTSPTYWTTSQQNIQNVFTPEDWG